MSGEYSVAHVWSTRPLGFMSLFVVFRRSPHLFPGNIPVISPHLVPHDVLVLKSIFLKHLWHRA